MSPGSDHGTAHFSAAAFSLFHVGSMHSIGRIPFYFAFRYFAVFLIFILHLPKQHQVNMLLSKPGFLSLGTLAIWDSIILCWGRAGAVLCIIGW